MGIGVNTNASLCDSWTNTDTESIQNTSVNDIFAIIWLENFDFFEFTNVDSIVQNLLQKSGLHLQRNFLKYIIFLRYMKNNLVCIHTYSLQNNSW